MRAQVIKEFGGPEKLQMADLPKPKAGPGQVLVKIHAAALNPVDAKIRGGLPVGPEMPAVLGCDLSGVVEAVGEEVTAFAPGDAVYGCAGGVKGHGGTLAEYIAADARLLARKPESLSFHQAAALPLVSITAWEAMDKLDIGEGDHVLILGGTGGVGHVAVQLAKARGAKVTATVSSDEAAKIARELGADQIVNHREDKVEDYVAKLTGGAGFDAIFDTVGGANLENSFVAAAVGGRVATINARATVDLGNMHGKALSLHVVFMLLPMLRGPGREAHGAILQQVAALADAGELKPLIDDHSFTLEQAGKAHALLDSGKMRGKIVVDIA
ncbi:MAG: zinc-dependent alcohol dehydrogenase family protein [Jhaorihella sp.]